MNTIQIRLYDLFRNELQLSDAKAAAFVSAVEEVVEQKEKETSHTNATKEDIQKLELKLKDDFQKLELKIKDNIQRLELKNEQSKNETNKAIYLSGLIQFLAILTSVIALVKLIK